MIPESTNTQASEFCLRPEWWHSENQTGTEIEVSEFIGGLVRLTQPEVCVETGSYLGQTSLKIGEALKKNGHGKLYTLENQPGYVDQVKGVVYGLPVECIATESRNWTPPENIDFIFFDTNDDRRLEFEYYLPFLNLGAILVLHDTHYPHHAHEQYPKLLELHGEKFDGIEFHNPRGLFVARMK